MRTITPEISAGAEARPNRLFMICGLVPKLLLGNAKI
jgi:hypothetical protein